MTVQTMLDRMPSLRAHQGHQLSHRILPAQKQLPLLPEGLHLFRTVVYAFYITTHYCVAMRSAYVHTIKGQGTRIQVQSG